MKCKNDSLEMLTRKQQLKKKLIYLLESRMENILDKADYLLRVGSVEEIMEFIPDLLLFFTKIDDQNAENEINLDGVENAEYIRLKKQKKD